MSKNWRDLEILIGILLFLIGGVLTYFIILLIIDDLDSFRKYSKLFSPDVSVGSILWSYHNLLVLLLMISVGGCFLIFEKKWGWAFSLLSSSIFTIFLLSFFFQADLSEFSLKWLFYLLVVILILIVIALSARPFRVKYTLSKKSKLYILALTIILLVDTFYRYL